jgi:transposase
MVFPKVTNGFCPDWEKDPCWIRSATGADRLTGQSALAAVRDMVDGKFAIA